MNNYDQFVHGHQGLFESDYGNIVDGIKTTREKCVAYVTQMFMSRLKEFSERVVVKANLENLPDKVLDLLAVELSIPFYENNMEREIKVSLLQEGYKWRISAGTVDGVESLARKVFGYAKVYEWFDYEGEPGNFKISTNALITEDIKRFFNIMLRKEKNVKSFIDSVERRDQINLENLYMGIHARKRFKKNPIIDMSVT